MPERFHSLPDVLLHNLGCASDQTPLEDALKKMKVPVPGLRQANGTDGYPLRIPGHGLDLMLQCLNPHVPDAERLWGLHSLTFHTARSEPTNFWRRKWPSGIDPDTATAGDIVSLLVEDDDDAVLMTDGMACFEVPGFDGRRWIVQCMFDPARKILLTFSLIRSGEWVHAQWRPEEGDA